MPARVTHTLRLTSSFTHLFVCEEREREIVFVHSVEALTGVQNTVCTYLCESYFAGVSNSWNRRCSQPTKDKQFQWRGDAKGGRHSGTEAPVLVRRAAGFLDEEKGCALDTGSSEVPRCAYPVREPPHDSRGSQPVSKSELAFSDTESAREATGSAACSLRVPVAAGAAGGGWRRQYGSRHRTRANHRIDSFAGRHRLDRLLRSSRFSGCFGRLRRSDPTGAESKSR